MIHKLVLMLYELTPRRLLFLGIVVGLSSLFILLQDYNRLHVGNNEFLHHLPYFTLNGLELQKSDVQRVFANMDGEAEHRPRFLAYAMILVDIKARLWMYQLFCVHPTASFSWFLTLLLTPWLLWQLVLERSKSRNAALSALVIYVTAIGFLSGFTSVLSPGKPLTNTAFMGAFLLAARIDNIANGRLLCESPGGMRYWLLMWMLTMFFLDEVPLFLILLLPIAFPKLFLPNNFKFWRFFKNVTFFCIPLVIYLITSRYLFLIGNPGDNPPFLANAINRFPPDFLSTLPRYILANLLSMVGTSIVPDQFANLIPVDSNGNIYDQKTEPLQLLLIGMASLLVSLTLYCAQTGARSRALQGLMALLAFVVLQATLQQLHVKIVNGFLYGSGFASLFAFLVGLLFACVKRSSKILSYIATVCVLTVSAVQHTNFLVVNDSWVAFHHKSLNALYPPRLMPPTHAIRHPAKLEADEVFRLWSAWKNGRLDAELVENGASSGALYLMFYLRVIDRHRHGLTPIPSGWGV